MSSLQSEMQESNSCVFLLGAGATAHLGYPLMREFMYTARRKFFDLKRRVSSNRETPAHVHLLIQNYEQMFAFQKRCTTAGVVFERDWENIEELYTQADLLQHVGNTPADVEEAAKICSSIALSIWDVYRRVERDKQERSHLLALLANTLMQTAVITTNYDTSVELALRSSGRPDLRPYYPGFVALKDHPTKREGHPVHDTSSRSGSLDYPSSGVPVIKLHGSANWFGLRSDPERVVANMDMAGDSNVGQEVSTALVANVEFDWERRTREFFKTREGEGEVLPVVVPPMLGKQPMWSAIRDQWEAAIHFLRKARQVWIIGYSFPRTDPFMTRLLMEGIRDNRDLQFFGFVDIAERATWSDRLAELFSPSTLRSKVAYFQSSALDFYSIANSRLSEDSEQDRCHSPFDDPFRFHAENFATPDLTRKIVRELAERPKRKS